MITGSFFTIGVSHRVCEDYAIHGEDYVILADGCSNGGGPSLNTDWGARILCKSAEQHIDLLREEECDVENFANRVIYTAAAKVSSFANLNIECLTATLVIAIKREKDILAIRIGDGVIGGKRKDGSWDITSNEFENSAPYYLKYRLNPADYKLYIERFGESFTEYQWVGKEELKRTKETRCISQIFCKQVFPLSEYQYVFIGSDGWSSFYERIHGVNRNIEIPEVLNVVTDFGNFQPGFLERQCFWIFRTAKLGSFKKLGWENSDDFSIGLIYCED